MKEVLLHVDVHLRLYLLNKIRTIIRDTKKFKCVFVICAFVTCLWGKRRYSVESTPILMSSSAFVLIFYLLFDNWKGVLLLIINFWTQWRESSVSNYFNCNLHLNRMRKVKGPIHPKQCSVVSTGSFHKTNYTHGRFNWLKPTDLGKY